MRLASSRGTTLLCGFALSSARRVGSPRFPSCSYPPRMPRTRRPAIGPKAVVGRCCRERQLSARWTSAREGFAAPGMNVRYSKSPQAHYCHAACQLSAPRCHSNADQDCDTAAAANGSKVRSADLYPPKMLRHGRMTGLVKRRRGIGVVDGGQQWADLDCAREPSGVGHGCSEPPTAMTTQAQANVCAPPHVRPPSETKGKPS